MACDGEFSAPHALLQSEPKTDHLSSSLSDLPHGEPLERNCEEIPTMPKSQDPGYLSPRNRERILRINEEYNREHARTKPIWLPESEIISLKPHQAADYGFAGLVREQDLDFDLGRLQTPDDFESLLKGGKKKKQPKGGSGPHSLPSATVVDQVISAYYKGMPNADITGPLVFGELNALFGSGQKALTYMSAWEKIVRPHHLMFWSEVAPDFCKEIGKHMGYGYWTSKDNSRGNQAVGFTAHPRLRLVQGPIAYNAVATVQGIQDLRPAYVCVFEDNWSGVIIKAMVVHLKSMRGGAKLTSPVRYQQCVEIVNAHGPATQGIKPALKNPQTRNTWRNQVYGRGFLDHGGTTYYMPLCVLPESERKLALPERIKRGITVMAGDWNTFLNQTRDLDPLINAGYQIVNPTDATPTHSMGGRLDGAITEPFDFPSCDADVQDGPDEITG